MCHSKYQKNYQFFYTNVKLQKIQGQTLRIFQLDMYCIEWLLTAATKKHCFISHNKYHRTSGNV